VHVCIILYICIYVVVRVQRPLEAEVCVCVCVCVRARACAWVCVCVFIHMYVHTCASADTSVHGVEELVRRSKGDLRALMMGMQLYAGRFCCMIGLNLAHSVRIVCTQGAGLSAIGAEAMKMMTRRLRRRRSPGGWA